MGSIKSICAAGQWLDQPLASVPHSKFGWLKKRLLLRGANLKGEDVHRTSPIEWLGQPCETMVGSFNDTIFKVAIIADYAASSSISLAMDAMSEITDALGIEHTPLSGEMVLWDGSDGNAVLQVIKVLGSRRLSLFLTSNILLSLLAASHT